MLSGIGYGKKALEKQMSKSPDMEGDGYDDDDEYGWDANPWVWVIAFEPCEKPKDDEN